MECIPEPHSAPRRWKTWLPTLCEYLRWRINRFSFRDSHIYVIGDAKTFRRANIFHKFGRKISRSSSKHPINPKRKSDDEHSTSGRAKRNTRGSHYKGAIPQFCHVIPFYSSYSRAPFSIACLH